LDSSKVSVLLNRIICAVLAITKKFCLLHYLSKLVLMHFVKLIITFSDALSRIPQMRSSTLADNTNLRTPK